MNDNEVNYEAIQNALKVIQNVCLNNNCETCPLGTEFNCFVTQSCPCDWRFADPVPVIRLLK